jgi:hypothetical protein
MANIAAKNIIPVTTTRSQKITVMAVLSPPLSEPVPHLGAGDQLTPHHDVLPGH